MVAGGFWMLCAKGMEKGSGMGLVVILMVVVCGWWLTRQNIFSRSFSGTFGQTVFGTASENRR